MVDMGLYLTTRVDVKEIGCYGGKWLELVRDRVQPSASAWQSCVACLRVRCWQLMNTKETVVAYL